MASAACGADTPPAPTDVRLSASAGSVSIEWVPMDDGPSVDQYVVLRDGIEVAEVAGEESSHQDTGLTPGTEYGYQIVAVAGSQRSEPTPVTAVLTPLPSPVNVSVHSSGPGRFALSWSPPADSPEPDTYLIVRNGSQIGTVPGPQTDYEDSEFALGSSYRYEVAASWAGNVSESSPAETVESFAAALQGSWQVIVTNTETPGGSVKVGDEWNETWTFAPVCAHGDCDVTLEGSLDGRAFSATLTPQDDAYTGTTNAEITTCGTTPLGPVFVENTLTFRLSPGETDNRELWTSWTGSLQMQAPYEESPMNPLAYCPAQNWGFALSSGSRRGSAFE